MSGGSPRVSRRGLLLGGAGFGVGVAVGAVGATLLRAGSERAADGGGADGGTVDAHGAHQPGVDRPATPQRHALVVVLDAPAVTERTQVRDAMARLGDAIDDALVDDALLPDGAGDLTVTVGIGPRLVRAVDPTLPGAEDLPGFAGDDGLDPLTRGGDVLLALHASDPTVLPAVAARLRAAVPDARARWQQAGSRGPGEGTIARNPLGYHDGVMVPTGAELDEAVWIADGPAAGGTIAVLRRLRLDMTAFSDLPVASRDRVIGRERVTGAPLSGGGLHDAVDVTAKTPEGEYLIPARSHVRAAHPSFTGSPLMLRRSYGFANGTDADGVLDDGLLFVCFQNDVDVFVRTQLRLDETDDLMRFTTPTASATFLILPGRRADAALGASLFR